MNPPTPSRLEVGVDVTVRVLYVVFLICIVWAFFPGMQELARRWLASAIYTYRVGRWGEEFARRPTWQREALRVRGQAPGAEPAGPAVPPVYLELQGGPQVPE